ncbi:MAG: hypothetical protein Q9204_007458 [Flavoplaca sp. TL-2023a]
MVTPFILYHLLFPLFLSILISNPIVSAIPTPYDQASPFPPSLPNHNSDSLIQYSPLPRQPITLSTPPPQTPSRTHTKRFFTTALATAGLHLILQNFDIILATAIEHAQLTSFFQDLHYKFGSETGLMLDGIIVVNYGLIKLAIWYDLNKVGLERVGATKIAVAEAMVVFAEVMLEVYRSVVFLPTRCWLRVEEAGVDVWVLIQMAVEDPRMLQGLR